MTNFEIRVEITKNLQRINDGLPTVFIRKHIQNHFDFREKYSSALKPYLELKSSGVFEADFPENTNSKDSLLPDKHVDFTEDR